MHRLKFQLREIWIKVFLFALILSLVITACAPVTPETIVQTVEVEKVVKETVEVEVEKEIVVTATPEPVVERGKYGGVLRGACLSPTTSLDPAYSKLGVCDRIAYRALYDLLVRMSATGDVVSDIATWEVSDDGLIYTFTLVRDDIMFHDGTTLDAEAVKVSLDRLRNPDSESPMAGILQSIAEVNVMDPTTVEVVLSEPNVGLLAAMTTEVGIPIISPAALEEFGEEDFRFNAVGSGPFKLVSWNVGDVAVFERNENYWQQDEESNPLPYLDGMELNGIDDETVRLLNLASGEFDVNERIRPENMASVEGYPDLVVYETLAGTAYAVTFNHSQPPFDDLLLRQAVQLGIDDDAIIDAVGFGTGYTLSWPVPKGVWYAPEVENPPYDPERAKELLAQAGYPNGLDVILTHISRPTDAQIAQIVQAQLAEIGINVEIQSLERTGWLDIWLKGRNENTEGQMAVFQHGVEIGDPGAKAIFLDPEGIVNFADWQNADMWELVQKQGQTYDQDERKAMWEEIYQMNVEDVAYVWLGTVPVYAAARNTVRDLELDPGSAWILTRTWLEEE